MFVKHMIRDISVVIVFCVSRFKELGIEYHLGKEVPNLICVFFLEVIWMKVFELI